VFQKLKTGAGSNCPIQDRKGYPIHYTRQQHILTTGSTLNSLCRHSWRIHHQSAMAPSYIWRSGAYGL